MKELNCRDVGFDCEGVVTGETEYDVLTQAGAHVKEVHGLTDEQVDDPGFGQQVSAQIRDKV
jgi:predicted small metal-binding protein